MAHESQAPLNEHELLAIVEAPDRLNRRALDAEDRARRCMADGSPVGAREWFDVAVRARQLAQEWEPAR